MSGGGECGEYSAEKFMVPLHCGYLLNLISVLQVFFNYLPASEQGYARKDVMIYAIFHYRVSIARTLH